MNLIQDGEYPNSQYAVISPILQAVFNDIQARNIALPQFAAQMTQLPPDDPGEAYSLCIYDRMGHVIFTRLAPNGLLELAFGTGGKQYGPKRVRTSITVPSQYTGLLSLLTVCWLTQVLNQIDLVPWRLSAIKQYYPEIVSNTQYSNILRTFCHNVLVIAEDSFTSSTDNVGYYSASGNV